MDDTPPQPSAAHLTTLIEDGLYDEVRTGFETLQQADTETQKTVLRTLKSVDEPATLGPILSAVTPFLTDEERSVRLTTAKLLVAVAEADPDAVTPVVSTIAARLADDEEFYYVRARCAEALGYVALDDPAAVSDPAILAEFRIGLEFDEPEVKEKLAKALEYVALGDPDRLRHQVSSLAEHLDDANELVRYHLCTALVAVGSEYPTKLTDAKDALATRLDDENPYVRGRAVEALGLLAEAEGSNAVPAVEEVPPGEDEAASFVTERVEFARRDADEVHQEVGTIESIRRGTDDVVEAITSPDTDGECPHCGLDLPDVGPPMCPGCGAPQ